MELRTPKQQLLAYIFATLALWIQPAHLAAETSHVALPRLETKVIAPRVVYIENPRFPGVTDADIRRILHSGFLLIEEHFGIAARIPDGIETIKIDNIFSDLVENRPDSFDHLIGEFRAGNVDWGRVRASLVEQIKKQKDPLSVQIAFARPYLTAPLASEDLNSFADAVTATFKDRLTYWTFAKLEDGHPVIGRVPGRDDLPLNEYLYWALMAKLGFEAEIILTNQLVASVEYIPIPIHSSIRGGITGGATDYNPSSQFGSSIWVSLFPYLSNDDRITELRNGNTYAREDALEYAGAMLAHELGHQLLQLGHPWSNDSCFMRPAEALDFASWVDKFDAENCHVGSSPAMTPGVLKIPVW